MNEILIATGNQHKFREIAGEFEEIDINPLSLSQFEIELERPESGKDYLENARIKADEAFDKSGVNSLADDSGLEVDALDGAPGIYSDRWAGENAGPGEQNQYLLDKLEGVEKKSRIARYVCEMVVVGNPGLIFHTRGECEGRIAFEPRGEGGFGYDPVFEVKEADWKTFGELPARVKNWLSHRALALNKLISSIRKKQAENG